MVLILEDSTINFLHGNWNYCWIKTDIDVMMLFKFVIKCVRLNFRAIALMISNSIYYVHMMVVCSWKTFENSLVKILKNSVSRVSTDREFPSIDWMFFFDRSNKNQESIESTWDFVMNLFNFSTDQICHFDQSNRNWESIKSSRKFVKIFFIISFDRSRDTFDRSKAVNFEFH